jgi:hypothetical protein
MLPERKQVVVQEGAAKVTMCTHKPILDLTVGEESFFGWHMWNWQDRLFYIFKLPGVLRQNNVDSKAFWKKVRDARKTLKDAQNAWIKQQLQALR